jgi:hypothetical protein
VVDDLVAGHELAVDLVADELRDLLVRVLAVQPRGADQGDVLLGHAGLQALLDQDRNGGLAMRRGLEAALTLSGKLSVTFAPGPTSFEIGGIPMGFRMDSRVAEATSVSCGGSGTVSPGMKISAESGSCASRYPCPYSELDALHRLSPSSPHSSRKQLANSAGLPCILTGPW